MLTAAQQQAIAAEGNVLVKAGAGTGKTRTLVERCVERLLRGVGSLDEILMVTFTEAAAAEMRQRIRARLEEEAAKQNVPLPTADYLAEQIALLDTAHISTLHSFCLELVRQHFHDLGIDPQIAVLDEDEAKLLAAETLDELLRGHYAGTSPHDEAVQQLILQHGRGWDRPIRELVLRLHQYTQTLPNPKGWLAEELAKFQKAEPTQWESWLSKALQEWRARWLPMLLNEPAENGNARQCAAALESLASDATREEAAACLEKIVDADGNWPARKKGVFRKPLERLFEEAEFLRSLAGRGDVLAATPDNQTATAPVDPLVEDWNWVRPHMATLLQLAQEFNQRFLAAKRELGVVDFHDLEQFALQLLWNTATNQPTPIAQQWQRKLRYVFVDEYQDINAAQDAILTALSREGAEANRFLVGDVKQSIYRFRLANPHIFQGYASRWSRPASQAQVISLADNFRSCEAILNFVNALFASLLREKIGGVAYGADDRLRFGAPEKRSATGLTVDVAPSVELHLRLKGGQDQDAETDGAGENENGATLEWGHLLEAEKEARLVALRLRDLKTQHHLVWDDESKMFRPLAWRDMVVLLRSPANKAESFAKEFTRLGMPLQVSRGGFYDSAEITDWLSLLTLLDNPLQDVPVLAVLRSPIVGLSLDELATIRLTQRSGYFWTAVQRFHETIQNSKFKIQNAPVASEFQQCFESQPSTLNPQPSTLVPHPATLSAWPKLDAFLQQFASWRRLARHVSLSQCVEAMLNETHYEAWLLTQPRGAQRHANVQRLLALTRQFDRFQRTGLRRFLKFIEAQREAEMDQEPAAIDTQDAVRLMSIHQSKGLEFPVVVLADLGKRFNLADLSADVILDEAYGLCPQVKPPHLEQRYPSLPYWLARQRQKQETLGEELRLLYVGLTRARDTLILIGSVARKTFEEKWSGEAVHELTVQQILSAKSYLDWLAAWLAQADEDWAVSRNGQNQWLQWTVYDDLDARFTASHDQAAAESNFTTANGETPAASEEKMEPAAWEQLQARLLWEYPFVGATREPAKTSVSILRRRLADEADEEAQRPAFSANPSFASPARAPGQLTPAEIGTAHHLFLQFLDLSQVIEGSGCRQEAERIVQAGLLTATERRALDLEAVQAFWQEAVGQQIRTQANFVHRELPFTARLTPDDLVRLNLGVNAVALPGEFLVVQGVVDLAVILPGEIWVLDFKTDRVTVQEMEEKVEVYRPQLGLYAAALNGIYRRPVTQSWLHFLALKRTVALI